MIICLPEKVKYIINTLMEAGFEAYAVGGCIRDCLLGRNPQDFDITTSATPVEVKALFTRTIDTGIKHGTVTVLLQKDTFEVTTYRIDGEYEDGRHPKEVQFTSDLYEDLRRRDFTINAMAYNDVDGLVDAFSGRLDLEKKIIRCVGNAKERFSEDVLRILRAIRFSAQLDYEIEEETKSAIRELAPTLSKISAERIQMEMLKLLTSPHPDYLRYAYDNGVTKVFLPEFDRAMETPHNHPHHCYSVGEHILHSLLEVPEDKVLRLTMLFHDMAKPDTLTIDDKGVTHFYGHPEKSAELGRKIMRRLKLDNDTIEKVYKLILYHDFGNNKLPTPKLVRKTMNQISRELFPSLLLVRRADIMAQSLYKREEKLSSIAAWQQCYEQILKAHDCVSLKELAVTGSDLINSGIEPGKQLGEILNELLKEVIDDPIKNDKKYLVERAKAIHQYK